MIGRTLSHYRIEERLGAGRSPHHTNIGWREVKTIRTLVRRVCSHASAAPSGLRAWNAAADRR